MKHWWSNVKVIVCGIVRCNELKTRCTKIKIHHCVHFSFQVSSAVNSTESNLIDLQPRVGLWACQYWELQISLLLFADYKWRTLRTCDCGAACRWGFAHAFFFFFLGHQTRYLWSVAHATSAVYSLCQIAVRCKKNSRRRIPGAGRSLWFSMIRDLGSIENQPSSTIHPVVCLCLISAFVSTPTLWCSCQLPPLLCHSLNCRLSPGTSEWLIWCCRNS